MKHGKKFLSRAYQKTWNTLPVLSIIQYTPLGSVTDPDVLSCRHELAGFVRLSPSPKIWHETRLLAEETTNESQESRMFVWAKWIL